MDDPERLDPDADAAEIAEWMEEDFGWAVAEGMANAGDEDEHEVVEVEILNHERGEVVGTIDTDRNLDTESEAFRTVSQEYLEDGVPVLVPTAYDLRERGRRDGSRRRRDDSRTRGFVRAFVDELPSPFDYDSEALADLPVHDEE